MHNGRTNLLPSEREQLLAREYRLRLSVVGLSFVTLLTLAAAFLLIPSYVLLSGSGSAKNAHLANIRSALASSDQATLSARLTALSNDAAALLALSNKPSVTKIMSSTLAISRPGITLSNFVYAAAAGKSDTSDASRATLTISGIAATRDVLRGYQLALQSAPSIRAAALPVSAYAKDANIDFTITLTLAP